MTNQKSKVLILGGGFAGIKTALQLAGDDRFDITLLSDQPDFRYYPTLYHAATGGRMAAASIPLSEIFKSKDVKIKIGTAKTVDRAKSCVKTVEDEELGYDKLVIALGVVTNYFGIKGLEKYSYGIKSQEQARSLREHIHKLLVDKGMPDHNYVIIGGGPTGVELAGALPSYVRHIMKAHGLKDKKLHIDLVEAAPRLMPRMPKDYSKAVARRLRRLGITLYLNQAVQAETADALMVSGHSIESHTVVWTAGVTNHPFFTANHFILTDHGKVAVDAYLQAETNIFVIGDNADTQYSGTAQTALHDAEAVSANLKRQARHKRMKAYKPKTPIYVTPVGPGWAAVLWNKVHIYGWLGWLMRSAADFVGYHDYEPWRMASKHWIDEYLGETDCQICRGSSKT